MFEGTGKVRTALFCIALFLSSFMVMWQMYLVVIVNDLYVAFPSDAGIITGILSWPALVTAVSSLLAGALLSKVSTKAELVASGILMLSALGPVFSSSIYVLLACCILMATAAGFANTAGMTIIGEVFHEEEKRDRVIGWYNATMSLISCGITLVGGMLAVNGWQAGFNVYWFVVPMLVLCILFLPDIRPEDRTACESCRAEEAGADDEEEGRRDGKAGFGSRFWIFYISAFAFFVAYCPFFSFISVYVSENALGGTDFAGLATSLTTVGSCIAGIAFGFAFDRMHRGLNVACYVTPILVYLAMYLFPSRAMTVVGCLVYGICYGGVFSFIYAYPGFCLRSDKSGMAMGFMTVNYSVGVFLGVYATTWLMDMLGIGVTATYPFAIGMLAIALCFEIPGWLRDRRDGLFENRDVATMASDNAEAAGDACPRAPEGQPVLYGAHVKAFGAEETRGVGTEPAGSYAQAYRVDALVGHETPPSSLSLR